MTQERFWFRCPHCREIELINHAQCVGNEPVSCRCGFKGSGIITPMVVSTEAVPFDFETKLTELA